MCRRLSEGEVAQASLFGDGRILVTTENVSPIRAVITSSDRLVLSLGGATGAAWALILMTEDRTGRLLARTADLKGAGPLMDCCIVTEGFKKKNAVPLEESRWENFSSKRRAPGGWDGVWSPPNSAFQISDRGLRAIHSRRGLRKLHSMLQHRSMTGAMQRAPSTGIRTRYFGGAGRR